MESSKLLRTTIILVVTLMVLGVTWFVDRSAGQTSDQESRSESSSEPHAPSAILPLAGKAVIEVAATLSDESRVRLRDALLTQGLTFAESTPDGFPNAGAPQHLDQNVWGLDYDSTVAYDVIRSRLLLWRNTAGDSDLKSGVLGILPGFENASDKSPMYYRPGLVAISLIPDMPLQQVADSLTSMPWLFRIPDSLQSFPLMKYLYKRVFLRFDADVDLFPYLDSLRLLPWIRGAAPVSLNWRANLPTTPPVPLMEEFAVGNLRKLSDLYLVYTTHVLDVDGLEAALEFVGSQMPVDSLGRIWVKITSDDNYDRLASELEAFDFQVTTHGEYPVPNGKNRLVVIGFLPCQWIRACTELESVLSLGRHSGPVIELNSLPEEDSRTACWVDGCTPACSSEGIAPSNADLWHSAGFFGQGVKIGIIDFFSGWLLQNAVTGCGLNPDILLTSHHFDWRVLATMDASKQFHGVQMAACVAAIAPCAEIFLAEPESQDQHLFLNDLRNIRSWLKANDVQVVQLAFTVNLPDDNRGWAALTPDGSDSLSQLLDSMVSVDGMVVIAAAGNSRHWHHERHYSPAGAIKYDGIMSSPIVEFGIDPVHNVTVDDDDLSYHTSVETEFGPRFVLTWRDAVYNGAPTKWHFSLLLMYGMDDDLVSFDAGSFVAATPFTTTYDDPPRPPDLPAWLGQPLANPNEWTNYAWVQGWRPTKLPVGDYHLMIENAIDWDCHQPYYQSLYPSICLDSAYYLTPDYVLELTVVGASFTGFHEPHAERNPVVYNDTLAGTIMLPPHASRQALSVGAYRIEGGTYGPRESFSSDGPVCSVFVADPSPNRPHILGPSGVHLPLGGAGNPFCGSLPGSLLSGTSPASAHVSGAAALALQAYPSLTPSQVKDTLIAWGKIIDPAEPPYLYLREWPLLGGFAKGDVNCDGVLTTADVITIVNYVYKAGPAPCPYPLAGDVNCTGTVNSSDAIYLYNHIFIAGPPPNYC